MLRNEYLHKLIDLIKTWNSNPPSQSIYSTSQIPESLIFHIWAGFIKEFFILLKPFIFQEKVWNFNLSNQVLSLKCQKKRYYY